MGVHLVSVDYKHNADQTSRHTANDCTFRSTSEHGRVIHLAVIGPIAKSIRGCAEASSRSKSRSW